VRRHYTEVGQFVGEVAGRLTTEVPGIASLAREIEVAATNRFESLEALWYSECHEAMIRSLRGLSGPEEQPTYDAQRGPLQQINQQTISHNIHEMEWSPLEEFELLEANGPQAIDWNDLNSAVQSFVALIPNGPRDWFCLTESLGPFLYPFRSEVDRDTARYLFFTPAYQISMAEGIRQSLGRIHVHYPDIRELPSRLDGLDLHQAAIGLYGAACIALRNPGSTCSLQSQSVEIEQPISTDFLSNRPNPVTPLTGQAVDPPRPFIDRDEYDRLVRIKEQIDPQTTYIGRSVPILRVFEQLDRLSTRLDRPPVVFLGPSGVGKTALARLLEQQATSPGAGASRTAASRFLVTSASEAMTSDFMLVTSRWAGYGKNSGVNGVPNEGTLGWLREYAGGTIFIDEAQDLTNQMQSFLHAVIDGSNLSPTPGTGPTFTPNVRLVFAMNRSLDELVETGRFRADFARRLRSNVVSIPSLNERRDDICLLVNNLLPCRVIDLSFLWILLNHDWSRGQVDELIRMLQSVGQSLDPGEHASPELLRQYCPDSFLLFESNQENREREVFQLLTEILEQQGFRSHARGALALGHRLAELLGINASQLSRMKSELDLTDADKS